MKTRIFVRPVFWGLVWGLISLSPHAAQAVVFSTDQDTLTIPEELRMPEAEGLSEPYWIDSVDISNDGTHGHPHETGYGTGESIACDGSCGRVSDWFFRGWLEQGFTWNPDNPSNKFNTPVTFNDRANEYQLNQIYTSFGREIPSDYFDWALGGRVDFLYGTDYFFTESDGLERRVDGTPKWNSSDGPRGAGAAMYGLSMPQLYAEVFVPVLQGLSVKLGHFYTILGYESPMATQNFFYSKAYVTEYGQPYTHTGLLGSVQASHGLVFHAGFTQGWNNWEDINDEFSFLGGVTLRSLDDRTKFAFALHSGREDADGADSRTVYSIVFSHQINSCLLYVMQHDYGHETNGALDGDARWYGVNQYLINQVSDTVALGMRVEWFRDQDNARVLGIPSPLTEGGNYTALTFGLNWNPCEQLTLRPEFRWDWSDVNPPGSSDGMFNDFGDRNQFTFATDLIYRF